MKGLVEPLESGDAAIPLPAPRVAPATTATFPASEVSMAPILTRRRIFPIDSGDLRAEASAGRPSPSSLDQTS